MPVQPIKQAGDLVGYQARWRNQSRYFAVHLYGVANAHRLASAALRELRAADPEPHERKRQRNNCSGITGIRLLLVPTKSMFGVPIPYVQASWHDRMGQPRSTWYSTNKHGAVGATELAIKARETAGQKVGLSPRQVWSVISNARSA